MKIMLISIILLFFVLPVKAQNNDCVIYSKILSYFNTQNSILEDSIQESSDKAKEQLKNKVTLQKNSGLNFYIIDKRYKFNNRDVKYWFSDLLKDKMILNHIYIADSDSLVKCIFPTFIKYQYRRLEQVLHFTEKDFNTQINSKDTIHVVPMRIKFSHILFYGSEALVYAKIFEGLGGGRDIAVYGFIFCKKGKNWELKKVASDTL